jgi:hypothetical protein
VADAGEARFDLVMAFDRDSTEFARGVEVGLAFTRLATEPRPVSMLTHVDNAEMVVRLAEAYGVRAVSVERGGDWLEVTFA